MSSQLLVHPRPSVGQSVECYLRQLARENGFPSALYMLRQVLGTMGPFSDRISMSQLRRFTGHSEDVLSQTRLSLLDSEGHPEYAFGAIRIPSYQLRSDEGYCPFCYKNLGYMKAHWRIAWLPACLEHQCWLEPHDGKAVHEDYIDLNDLSRTFSVPEYVLKVQHVLEQRLQIEAQQYGSNPTEDSVIELIDQHLLKALKLDNIESIRKRKRRHPMRYFPLDDKDTLKFMECLHVQLAAEE